MEKSPGVDGVKYPNETPVPLKLPPLGVPLKSKGRVETQTVSGAAMFKPAGGRL
jgi:hypothetical protein